MKTAKLTLLCASLAIMILVSTGLGYAVIDPGTVVGMWLFDEGSGNKVEDSSGNGNEGSIKGGADWVKGRIGGALELDGSDSYVEIADDESLNITDDITIVAWVRPSGNNAVNYSAILQRQQASNANVDTYYFGFNSNNRLHFGTYGGNTQSVQDSWDNGRWYHVAATYTVNGLEGHLYIDGAEVDLAVDNAETMAGGSNELYIGRWNAVYLYAAVDDIAIFNTVLDEEDIEKIVAEGVGKATGLAAVSSEEKLAITWGEIKR